MPSESRAGQSSVLTHLSIKTPRGLFLAGYSLHGLAILEFPGPPPRGQSRELHTPPNRALRRWHRLTRAAVACILRAEPPGVLPPLDFSRGTAFQRLVWNALRRIGIGSTRSYGEVARAIRRPRAVRAVGRACGSNPIPLIVPCHRVLAAGGRLGGFSAGLNWKRLLLEREGVRLRNG